jgi:hypothetical protein
MKSSCHEVNASGRLVAPDLSAAGKSSADHLRQMIVNLDAAMYLRRPISRSSGSICSGGYKNRPVFLLFLVLEAGYLLLFILFYGVEVVNGQIGPNFRLAVRPQDFDFVDTFPTAETEMNAKIVLRKITSATQNFAGLHQVTGGGFHPRVERQPVPLASLQRKADPVIRRTTLWLENHGPAFKIFDH